MASKESLERAKEFCKSRLKTDSSTMLTDLADLRDEAIREARLDVLEHLVDQQTIISFPMGSGFNRQLLVRDYAAQLREGKT